MYNKLIGKPTSHIETCPKYAKFEIKICPKYVKFENLMLTLTNKKHPVRGFQLHYVKKIT